MAVKVGKTRAKKASENWMATGRDQIAAQFVAGMIDSRYIEVRRKADHAKVVDRAYELADALIERSQANS